MTSVYRFSQLCIKQILLRLTPSDVENSAKVLLIFSFTSERSLASDDSAMRRDALMKNCV